MADKGSWSQPWTERSTEEARLFNPAFCGELICRTVGEYYRTQQSRLGFVIAFLVLPLTLHSATREALPRRADVAFAGWIAEHGALLVDVPDRTRRLRPVSREALLFAVGQELLLFEKGGLVPGTKTVRPQARPSVSTDEVNAMRSAAGLLGRWFARQGTEASILRGIGVAP